MATHTVEPGECLSSVAAKLGFPSWKELYERAENAALRETRANPNVLAPGDVVDVPDEQKPRTVTVPSGRRRFKVARSKVKLRIALHDESGEAIAGKRFVVQEGETPIEGTTTPEGLVEVDIPASVDAAQLRVWIDPDDEEPTIEWELAIGHLDPVDSTAGLQSRLHNLGFGCEVTGELDDATRAAIRGFRAKHGLPDSDEADDALGAKLCETHDGG